MALSIALMVSGCSAREPINVDLTDQPVPFVAAEEGYKIYRHNYDNMDRGNHEYYKYAIVVDPKYYREQDLQRGDVILYNNPDFTHESNPNLKLSEQSISRIIALPGETIEIIEGQIYINERSLNSFYGRAHRLGSDLQKLRELAEKDHHTDNIAQNIKNMIDYMETDHLDKHTVPRDHVFIIGDDWFRSADSRLFDSLPVDSIQGKVLGYSEAETG